MGITGCCLVLSAGFLGLFLLGVVRFLKQLMNFRSNVHIDKGPPLCEGDVAWLNQELLDLAKQMISLFISH